MPQATPIAIVTGASRGAGRGIAIALGSHGCTVYVTGRSQKAGDASLPGTIYETAAAVTAAGGKGIAVRVDHADDAQVKALFEQVEREQGRLDILVNNAAAVHDELPHPGNFWEKPIELGNLIDVGVRSGYIASFHAAPVMVAQQHGLVIFTSSAGGIQYMMGPAYGAHKAGMDKMAADMAFEFKPHNVAVLSIWMGGVRTERVLELIANDPEKYGFLHDVMETPEFTGEVIWALYNDPGLMEMSGLTVIGAEVAVKYGIKDVGGRQPPSDRATYDIKPMLNYPAVIV